MSKCVMCAVVCLGVASGCGSNPAASSDGGVDGSNPGNGDGATGSGDHDLGSCTIFPTATGSRDDYTYWNLDITSATVDPMSDAYISSMGMTTNVQPQSAAIPRMAFRSTRCRARRPR